LSKRAIFYLTKHLETKGTFMKLNYALIAFGLAASTAAFASTPTYQCGTTPDTANVKNAITLTLENDGSIGVTTTGMTRKMERSSEVTTPAGYTAFTGESGCVQHPGAIASCGAISLSTLYVTYPMVSGTPEGKAVLNGQDLFCSMQMMD
jgi:hypothetical protein